jgi:hypothetical protein
VVSELPSDDQHPADDQQHADVAMTTTTDVPPLQVAPQYRRDEGFRMYRLPR